MHICPIPEQVRPVQGCVLAYLYQDSVTGKASGVQPAWKGGKGGWRVGGADKGRGQQ